MQQPPTQ
jgi:hypothetical protein